MKNIGAALQDNKGGLIGIFMGLIAGFFAGGPIGAILVLAVGGLAGGMNDGAKGLGGKLGIYGAIAQGPAQPGYTQIAQVRAVQQGQQRTLWASLNKIGPQFRAALKAGNHEAAAGLLHAHADTLSHNPGEQAKWHAAADALSTMRKEETTALLHGSFAMRSGTSSISSALSGGGYVYAIPQLVEAIHKKKTAKATAAVDALKENGVAFHGTGTGMEAHPGDATTAQTPYANLREAEAGVRLS